MVSGEGHTVPERVGPRGADNAANPVLACLPCAQAVNPPGRRPLSKKDLPIWPLVVQQDETKKIMVGLVLLPALLLFEIGSLKRSKTSVASADIRGEVKSF